MTDFNDIYHRYSPDVFRYALYLTGNRADAEDLTADTFARVWATSAPIKVTTVKAYLPDHCAKRLSAIAKAATASDGVATGSC